MTFTRTGGLAALTCAVTYLIGFALLVTILAPLGYGSADIDPNAVVAFINEQGGILTAWNTTIYIVNGLALAVLVLALAAQIRPFRPSWAAVTQGIGLMWATLVLGAGMVANVAIERAAYLYPTDPEAAASTWSILTSVELGLGGGNEIAGGVWILLVSLVSWSTKLTPRFVAAIGILTGASGLLTVIPLIGQITGEIFGLGAIVWFIAVGISLLRNTQQPQAA